MRPPNHPRPPSAPKRSRPVIGKAPARSPSARPAKLHRQPLPRPPKPSVPRPKAHDRALAGSMNLFGEPETNSSLLDLVDNLLSKGVVLHADAILALADVDLVYLRLTALLVAADRVFGPKTGRR